jgi:hypothetical protein
LAVFSAIFAGFSQMSANAVGNDLLIGFLSVECRPARGYVGGHLVLNSRGRPIEFRCTAPVQPSRAQEVLYGPTLAPYVCGELIADALFTSTKTKPDIVFTDALENMSCRNGLNVPLVLVYKPSSIDTAHVENIQPGKLPADPMWRIDAAAKGGSVQPPKWIEYKLGQRHVAVLAEFESDQPASQQLWEKAGGWIDLAEPFERISEAIGESLNG